MADIYDARTRHLHWLTALLVGGLWVAGHTIDWFPSGTLRVFARSTHMSFGVLLGLVLLVRVFWRFSGGTRLPAAGPARWPWLSSAGHGLLYLLVATVVILGVACVWIRGDSWYGVFTVPSWDPDNKALREDAVELHELMANILLGLAGAHAVIALWHHRIKRDGVLRRMLPSL